MRRGGRPVRTFASMRGGLCREAATDGGEKLSGLAVSTSSDQEVLVRMVVADALGNLV